MVLYSSTIWHRTNTAQPSLSFMITSQEDQDVVAYLGESHGVCHGCSLRTMMLLIMLSPSSLVMAIRGVHLCPGFLLLSRHTYICSLSQFSSVTQSCPTICNPMNYSKPGLPVRQQLSVQSRVLQTNLPMEHSQVLSINVSLEE